MKKLTLLVSSFLLCLGSYAQQTLWGGTNLVSPQINEDKTVTFRIHAPKASKVEIEGDFLPPTKVDTPFGPQEVPSRAAFKEGKNGVWEYTSSVLPSELYSYSLYVNDLKMPDPNNVYQNRDIATNLPAMKAAKRNIRYFICCMELVVTRMRGQNWDVPHRFWIT